jgi:1,2-diacylglycerol 3-alpha-glucosyltransferase
MKILMISGTYLPSLNGNAISTHNFKHGLEQLGHEVWVIVPRYKDYRDQEPHVLRVATMRNIFYPQYPFPLLFATRSLIERLRKEKFDLVHVMQPFLIGRYARKIARALNVPLIFTNHARYDLYSSFIPLVPRRLSSRIVVRSAHRFANSAAAVIAPSESIKKYLLENKIFSPITVVPTGLSRSCKVPATKEFLKKKIGIPPSALLLLTVSRISLVEKNFPLLLASYGKIADKLPEHRLLIVGGGPDLDELKQEVQDRGLEHIRFTGFVPNEKVPQYYSAADLFVYPSVSETQGLTILEALSAGLPVITPRAPGNQDVVVHNVNGFLTKNDADNFSEHILKLVNDPRRRKEMSVAAEKTAQPFTRENMARKMLEVYQGVIKRHAQSPAQKQ